MTGKQSSSLTRLSCFLVIVREGSRPLFQQSSGRMEFNGFCLFLLWPFLSSSSPSFSKKADLLLDLIDCVPKKNLESSAFDEGKQTFIKHPRDEPLPSIVRCVCLTDQCISVTCAPPGCLVHFQDTTQVETDKRTKAKADSLQSPHALFFDIELQAVGCEASVSPSCLWPFD